MFKACHFYYYTVCKAAIYSTIFNFEEVIWDLKTDGLSLG